jgi:osmotically-inducible protein OsmY
MDGAEETMQIKSALMADKSVDASGINVDTNGTTKTVTLKGHVPNAAQKAAAERIAKNKAPDYKVVYNLTIG